MWLSLLLHAILDLYICNPIVSSVNSKITSLDGISSFQIISFFVNSKELLSNGPYSIHFNARVTFLLLVLEILIKYHKVILLNTDPYQKDSIRLSTDIFYSFSDNSFENAFKKSIEC